METAGRLPFLLNPRFQVMATWGWNFIGNFLVLVLAALILPANISVDQQAMQANPKLALIPIAGEIIATGLLPVVFTLFKKESLAKYGLKKNGLGKSFLLATLVVALLGQPHTGELVITTRLT